MCCKPNQPLYAAIDTPQNSTRAMASPHGKTEHNSLESHSTDLELNDMGDESIDHEGELDLNHYNIVNEVWYYCSVDWGSRCEPSCIFLRVLVDAG